MGYHHLALAARDMTAIHQFYETVMGFELVKAEVGPAPQGGWENISFIAWKMTPSLSLSGNYMMYPALPKTFQLICLKPQGYRITSIIYLLM